MSPNKSRNTIVTVVLVTIAAAVVGVEEFVLKGDRILRETVRAGSGGTVSFEVTRAGVKHTVEVRPFSGKRALKIAVEGPEGAELFSRMELGNREGPRVFNVVPEKSGTHTVTIARRALSRGSFSCTVEVLVNDRRILRPLTSKIRL